MKNNTLPDQLAVATTPNFGEPEFEKFEQAYGEPFSKTLDLTTWSLGENLDDMMIRLDQEIADAVEQAKQDRETIRKEILLKLGSGVGPTKQAVLKRVDPKCLEKVMRGLLFNGGVEACDGTSVVHDTIPLTITQIGVCLVSYNGTQGSWVHRLFRRDLRERSTDLVSDVMELLYRRERREGVGQEGDELSELARRGIMAYAERAILRERSSALWRMGHGSPAPFEILSNLWASKKDRIQTSIDLIDWYVNQHKRFIFVPSAPRRREVVTLGDALLPMEFAVLQTLEPEITNKINRGGYRAESGVLPLMREFAADIASKIVVGIYRVSRFSPASLFYAHEDHIEMAAHIAMADSIIQEHRGFPMLIDLADTVCRTTFGVDTFINSVQVAYTNQDTPFRYLGERETRS
jgi:hypothetical protein